MTNWYFNDKYGLGYVLSDQSICLNTTQDTKLIKLAQDSKFLHQISADGAYKTTKISKNDEQMSLTTFTQLKQLRKFNNYFKEQTAKSKFQMQSIV